MKMAKYLFYSTNLILQQFRLSLKRSMCTRVDDPSHGMIKVTSNNPFDLFDEWFKEASRLMSHPLHTSFILSTYSPNNKVTSRILKILRREDDKFLFAGSEISQKIQDLRSCPDVSMCFWWNYKRHEYLVLRQVRITGTAKEKSKELAAQLFPKIPFPLQVEFIISRQNEPVKDWFEKQALFRKTLEELKNANHKTPDYITLFEITTQEIQFFHNIVKTDPFFIADRVLFQKDGDKWKHMHISA